MAIDVTDMQARATACADAIEAGDYSTARMKAVAAMALMTFTPDTEFDNSMVTKWRNQFDNLMRSINQLEAYAASASYGGMQTTQITPVEPGCSSEDE